MLVAFQPCMVALQADFLIVHERELGAVPVQSRFKGKPPSVLLGDIMLVKNTQKVLSGIEAGCVFRLLQRKCGTCSGKHAQMFFCPSSPCFGIVMAASLSVADEGIVLAGFPLCDVDASERKDEICCLGFPGGGAGRLLHGDGGNVSCFRITFVVHADCFVGVGGFCRDEDFPVKIEIQADVPVLVYPALLVAKVVINDVAFFKRVGTERDA